MMVGQISRLSAISTANNAAYNWMRASDSLMSLCSFTGNVNPMFLLNADQQLTSDMATNATLYKISMAREESLKKLSDENIKRTFSTFA